MKIHLSRAVVAIGLGASLWFGSISSFAAPQDNKTQSTAPSQSQSAKTDTQNQSTTPPQTQPVSHKPLSTSDDPTMIGKRNINKGIWSGGILGAKGVDSEVKLGRQLAAQDRKSTRLNSSHP